MRGWVRAIALMVCAATAGAASAEPVFNEPPKGSDVWNGQFDPDEAVRLMNSYARCVAKGRKAKAEAFLALPLDGEEQHKASNKLTANSGDCMPRILDGRMEISFQIPLLAGGAAEALILDRYGKSGPLPLAAAGAEGGAAPAPAPRNAMESFGQCVMLQDPQAVRAIVATEPAGKEEAAALRPVRQHLANCIPEGQTLALNKANLRALLAVALYRALSAGTAPLASAAAR
ncbi:MAG TPA: hypothetical protein VF727_15780 [Allosphingosinicella sp.]|jgi:hypothetical protein